MGIRDNTHKFIQSYSLQISLGLAAVITLAYLFFPNWGSEANQLIGKIVNTILTSFTLSGSLVAFCAVVVAPDEKWGEMKELRTNIGIGCLVGILASAVMLVQTFKAA